MKHIILDTDGATIISAGEGGILPSEAILVDTPLSPLELTQHLYSVVSEEITEESMDGEDVVFVTTTVDRVVLTPRPVLPTPFRVGNQITSAGIPSGTHIEIFDETGRDVLLDMVTTEDDYLLDVTLPDAGHYAIHISPPHPWLSLEYRFEVTA